MLVEKREFTTGLIWIFAAKGRTCVVEKNKAHVDGEEVERKGAKLEVEAEEVLAFKERGEVAAKSIVAAEGGDRAAEIIVSQEERGREVEAADPQKRRDVGEGGLEGLIGPRSAVSDLVEERMPTGKGRGSGGEKMAGEVPAEGAGSEGFKPGVGGEQEVFGKADLEGEVRAEGEVFGEGEGGDIPEAKEAGGSGSVAKEEVGRAFAASQERALVPVQGLRIEDRREALRRGGLLAIGDGSPREVVFDIAAVGVGKA